MTTRMKVALGCLVVCVAGCVALALVPERFWGYVISVIAVATFAAAAALGLGLNRIE